MTLAQFVAPPGFASVPKDKSLLVRFFLVILISIPYNQPESVSKLHCPVNPVPVVNFAQMEQFVPLDWMLVFAQLDGKCVKESAIGAGK